MWRVDNLKEEIIRVLKENNGSVSSSYRLRSLIEPKPGVYTVLKSLKELEEEGRVKFIKKGRAKKIVLANTEKIPSDDVATEILKDILKLLVDGKTQEAIMIIVRYLARKGVL